MLSQNVRNSPVPGSVQINVTQLSGVTAQKTLKVSKTIMMPKICLTCFLERGNVLVNNL